MSIAEMELGDKRAVVAPRAVIGDGIEPAPLADRVETMLRRGVGGEFNLFGAPGCGKSTAMAELARVFAREDRLKLVDDGLIVKPALWGAPLVISASTRPARALSLMELAPWGRDEWIEYMLARWRGRCNSVMGRVLKDPFADWLHGNAELWAATLDEMAVGPDSLDIRAALRRRLARVALSSQRHAEGAAMCMQLLTRQLPQEQFELAFSSGERDFSRLLRHRIVQVLVASDCLVHWLCDIGDTRALDGKWPGELIRETARGLKQRSGTIEILESVLEASEIRLHPVAASLLLAVEPTWRPAARYVPNLCSAHLQKAQWPHVDLFAARLVETDLREANLQMARLQKANATHAKLSRADLRNVLMAGICALGGDFSFANMAEAQAEGANFGHADLQGANLEKAQLHKVLLAGANLNNARLCGADLRKANLVNANFEGADFSNCDLTRATFKCPDLRETILSGARLHKAWLLGSNMEEMDLRGADLSGAVLNMSLLTGACLAGVNLRKADLRETGLAGIDLEGADLRRANLGGASFHLGSTRSGLVGSVIPCEGSKVGFYTDEREEQSFRRPEEIRKANLSHADLRGAKIKGVDFYLVDVRGAKYSSRQGKYLKRCGAIMT